MESSDADIQSEIKKNQQTIQNIKRNMKITFYLGAIVVLLTVAGLVSLFAGIK